MYFARLTADQRNERIERIIRVRTNDLLDSEHVQSIADAIDRDRQYAIEVVSDPDDFERLLTLKKTRTKRSDGHIESCSMEGFGIFGSFSFGEDSRIYDENHTRAVGKLFKGKLHQTDMPAAAILSVSNTGFSSLRIPLSEEKIIIYLPFQLFKLAS